MMLLHYKIGKEGVTNYQAWLQIWREHETTKFDELFQDK